MTETQKKCREIVNDLRDTGHEIVRVVREKPEGNTLLALEICGMKMLTAANWFERLLGEFSDMEDDGK